LVALVREPLDDHGRIQPAGIGEHHLLAASFGHVAFRSLSSSSDTRRRWNGVRVLSHRRTRLPSVADAGRRRQGSAGGGPLCYPLPTFSPLPGAPMRLGLILSNSGPEQSWTVALVQEAERLGYHVVWGTESYGSDAVTPLAYLAGQTKTIRL